MLVATELPIHYQHVLSALTDYDFVIGPIYARCKEYADFYKGQRSKGRFVVLDNGAFESELLSEQELLEIVQDLRPQEVVAPDVISDRAETYNKTWTFANLVKDANVQVVIQATAQGKSLMEMTESYRELADLPGVGVLGISYVGHFTAPEDCRCFGTMAPEEAVRLRFFHHLIGQGLLRDDKPHHLLGLCSPSALSWYARYPFIRSIDTSFPVICATHRTRMGLGVVKFPDKLDYERQMSDEEIALAIENILWMKAVSV